jgi:hypothetical protein
VNVGRGVNCLLYECGLESRNQSRLKNKNHDAEHYAQRCNNRLPLFCQQMGDCDFIDWIFKFHF